MDFYRFINSKDIREYHWRIGYEYNAAEAAWLVLGLCIRTNHQN